ncbi:hypothetical protein [Streptomyces sp. NRRL F-5123]|nr:hypothetical protein [Streptomyces sp. NRRL F-5123]
MVLDTRSLHVAAGVPASTTGHDPAVDHTGHSVRKALADQGFKNKERPPT